MRVMTKEGADTLETAIREVAIFTKWQECPQCREGYLGYWIEPRRKSLVLSCPECTWEQDLSGKRWVVPSPLLPASLEDLGMQSTPRDERNLQNS